MMDSPVHVEYDDEHQDIAIKKYIHVQNTHTHTHTFRQDAHESKIYPAKSIQASGQKNPSWSE